MDSFGIEHPAHHVHVDHASPAKYLILIESDGFALARLFLDTRVEVAEFDASSHEVALMTDGLLPEHSALGAEWDAALGGHTTSERASATVYTLDV